MASKTIQTIRRDFAANPGNPKARLVLLAFRLASRARYPRDAKPHWWAVPVGVIYRLTVEWVLGIEIPWRSRIGDGLVLYHGFGTVINDEAILGEGVTLRHGVTVGVSQDGGGAPIVGDGVVFGAGSMVIGAVEIGANTVIGAGAVVVRSCPPRSTLVGVPAHPVRRTDPSSPPSFA